MRDLFVPVVYWICYTLGILLLAVGCLAGEVPPVGEECEVSVTAGVIVITEIFADAVGSDAGKEWFELYNASGQSLPLQGLTLSSARADGSATSRHVLRGGEIAADAYFVVGNAANDRLPFYLDYGYENDLDVGSSRGLPNTAGSIEIRCGPDPIDAVVYPSMQTGVALQLRENLVPNAAGNDEAAQWCSAIVEFAEHSLGTPGHRNTVCADQSQFWCMERSIALFGRPRRSLEDRNSAAEAHSIRHRPNHHWSQSEKFWYSRPTQQVSGKVGYPGRFWVRGAP